MVTAAVLMLMIVVILIMVVVVVLLLLLHQMVDTGQVQDDDIGIKAASMHKLVLFLDRLPPKRSQCLFLNSRMWRCLDKKWEKLQIYEFEWRADALIDTKCFFQNASTSSTAVTKRLRE